MFNIAVLSMSVMVNMDDNLYNQKLLAFHSHYATYKSIHKIIAQFGSWSSQSFSNSHRLLPIGKGLSLGAGSIAAVLPAGISTIRHLATIPLGTRDGVHSEHVHGINFLQRAVLGLDHEEEDNDCQCQAASGEDQAVKVVDCIRDEACEEGDEEVPQPVRCRGESHCWSPVFHGVQLTDNSPDEWTPCRCKSSNEQAREDNQDVARSRRLGGISLVQGEVAHETVHHEAHKHPQSSDDEGVAATALLDDPETADGARHVDSTQDDLRDVGVTETGGLEDGCSVIEEEIRSGELLAGLQDDSESNTVKHLGSCEELDPFGFAGSSLLFVLDPNVVHQ